MFPVIFASQRRRAAAWSPASLTGLAATLLPALSRSQGKLWQNTAKTIPAVADGDPVRVAVCPYTAVELTALSDAARPLLYDEGGGKWSLSFDGVDDRLVAPSDVTLGDLVCGWVAIRNAGAGDKILLGSSSIPSYLVDLDGTAAYMCTVGGISPGSNTFTQTVYHYAVMSRTGSAVAWRVNGSAAGTSTASGNIIHRNVSGRSGTLFFSGRVSAIVLASSYQTTTDLETFLSSLKP